ncbi:TrmH family RNA methyltransferase [Clostridium vitabionis]|uniref:TrmH family RNA methyltransferase n=1 Tax=Clostridium vitabionis TaxID=2784388 RepID=UPI00188CD527|nr:RNA methyltransferase [Clostridium vitabionis]
MVDYIPIHDFDDPALSVYARLREPELLHAFEPGPGLFIAESPKVIGRALDAGYRPVSLLAETGRCTDPETAEVIARCAEAHAGENAGRVPENAEKDFGSAPASFGENAIFPVYTADFQVLSRLTGFPLTRGVLCAMRRRALPPVSDILHGASRIAVFESVENPTNLGAMFRSAAALGVDAVLLSPGCTDPLYRRAARVSMGTVFQVPWTSVRKAEDWPENCLKLLRREGFFLVSLALRDDAVPLDDPRLREKEKLALILGTEGDGLTEKTIRMSDIPVIIPMGHGVDSLNVAAASAVAFWELRKR